MQRGTHWHGITPKYILERRYCSCRRFNWKLWSKMGLGPNAQPPLFPVSMDPSPFPYTPSLLSPWGSQPTENYLWRSWSHSPNPNSWMHSPLAPASELAPLWSQAPRESGPAPNKLLTPQDPELGALGWGQGSERQAWFYPAHAPAPTILTRDLSLKWKQVTARVIGSQVRAGTAEGPRP